MSADGTWNTTMNTPMGAQQGTMNIATDGGSLSGTVSGPQGDIEVSDGTVDGNNLTWKAAITTPMAMTLEFSASVEGDELKGSVKLGAFGNADEIVWLEGILEGCNRAGRGIAVQFGVTLPDQAKRVFIKAHPKVQAMFFDSLCG